MLRTRSKGRANLIATQGDDARYRITPAMCGLCTSQRAMRTHTRPAVHCAHAPAFLLLFSCAPRSAQPVSTTLDNTRRHHAPFECILQTLRLCRLAVHTRCSRHTAHFNVPPNVVPWQDRCEIGARLVRDRCEIGTRSANRHALGALTRSRCRPPNLKLPPI